MQSLDVMVPRGRAAGYFLVCFGLALAAMPTVATAVEPVRSPIETPSGMLEVTVRATGLGYPWSAVLLPDGDLLVAEKHPGQLRRVAPDGQVGPPLAGLPEIYGEGNGGLLGLALDPDFASTGLVYFAFSEPGDGPTAGLSVARAALHEDHLGDVEVIFRQQPKVWDDRNFGGRLLFAPDGRLFVLTGDRFAHDLVQATDNTIGVVARIEPDGTIPDDNPFVGQEGFDPAIWTLGHRNIGGGAFDPATGRFWLHEFGPFGGDELNLVEAGENYGWPLVSWGRHYTGEPIADPRTRPDFALPKLAWTPAISPSGAVFYTAGAMPAWQGNLLTGGLSSQSLIRLVLDDDRVVFQERIELGVRIRDVLVDRDGAVLVLTDEPDGRILRLVLQAD